MQIIIFGAGYYGASALDFFGTGKVAFFVDNDVNKTGKIYCGKEILSFRKYIEIQEEYETVIALNSYMEIADQLRKEGVCNFRFFSPQYTKALELVKKVDFRNKKIAFIGICEYTEQFIKDILCNIKKQVTVYVSDIYSSDSAECLQYEIINIKELPEDIDWYLLSSPRNAYAVQVRLMEIIPKEKIINPFIQTGYYDTPDIIYNPYLPEFASVTEKEWNAFNLVNKEIDEISEYADALSDANALFEHVEIETINQCNGSCDFCPVSIGNDIREKKIMEEGLFRKIIDELSEIHYSGRLSLFSNNEPFLDERILQFHKYAREKLPTARMHLFTNGTLLTLDKFIELMNYLDELIIDNYNQDLKLHKNSLKIKEYCEMNPEYKKRVTIVLRKPHEILTSRGGDAPNRKELQSYPNAKCVLPFKQLIIRPDGKISLCCNDPWGKMTLGDAGKETLLDIWYGAAFRNVRKQLLGGRKNLEHCRYCDTFIQF